MKDIIRARYTLEFKQEAVRLVEGGETVSSVARTLGVSFQSVDNWIKAAAAGRLRDVKLIFHIFGALAEFERAVIRERTREGLLAARKRGRVGGRPSALSDKDISIARTLLADATIPVAEIARRLNVSPATFYRHVRGERSAPAP